MFHAGGAHRNGRECQLLRSIHHRKNQTLIMPIPRYWRFIFVAFAGTSLLVALWSGLARLGWNLPVPNIDFVSLHGPLMVIGFLSTLIGLERAAAVARLWVYGIPLFSALTFVSLVVGAPLQSTALFAIIAASLFTVFFAGLYLRQPSEHFAIMTLSTTALCVGNIIWIAEAPLSQVVPWWVGFLVLMIAGERLELNRIRRPPFTVRVQFHASVAIVMFGLLVSVFAFFVGVRVAAVGLIALAFWLLRYDLAWQSLRQPGLPRFMAGCLIVGYIWLAVGGALWLSLAGSFVAGPVYDAMLHSVFLGFVFSMIFAHAPVIFPTITEINLPFQKVFYLHAILLHLSLVLRVVGDLTEITWEQQWGGALGALSIIVFLLNNIRAMVRN
jgi:hypothetical protein